MSTVINNPGDSRGDSSGVGIIVGIILAVLLVALFFVYLLPMMRNQATPVPATAEIDVNIPEIPAQPSAPAPAEGE